MPTFNPIRHGSLAALVAIGITAGSAAQADTRGTIARLDPATNKYCVTERITGSMIPRRMCATRQEWADMGALRVAKPVTAKASGNGVDPVSAAITRPQTRLSTSQRNPG